MEQNTPEFLAMVVQGLAAAQVHTWLFGGWAEELSGLRPPQPHQDVDLLYPAATFDQLDQFLLSSGKVEEIAAKRFVHKRAFRWHGVLVEVFLVCPGSTEHTTNFFGVYPFQWPEDTLSGSVLLCGETVASASATALNLYRHQHRMVEQAYQQHRDSA